MAKSQEHSFLMFGWQKNFANKLIGEWRKYIAELDKLPSLHAQSTHTHPVKTYDVASFNAHNNLINGMKSVTFDVTIDKTGKKTDIVENDLFPNIIENMSQSVSVTIDNRVNKSFILKGLAVAFYDEISKYVLQFRYELNGKEVINRRFINSYSELNEILDEYIPHIINLLKKEVFYSSTINDDHYFMGEVLRYDSGDVWTSWRRVWQKGGFANHGCTGGQSWHWEYPDVDPHWKYNADWIYSLDGQNVNIKNGAVYNNGRGNQGANYYKCERTGRNEHSTGSHFSS